jgi:phytoene desaturase
MLKVGVIGSGFAGLSAASTLAKAGYEVTIIEKNSTLGGRARSFSEEGFTFDMGPSWYWMPEVFEDYYRQYGHEVSDFYELIRLDPSYKIYYPNNEELEIPAATEDLYTLFEGIEAGSSHKLKKFLEEAKYKYEVGMSEFVWKPGNSIMEFVDIRVFKSFFKLQMFTSIAKQVRTLFKNEKLRSLLEFPVLFLGAKPEDTPALYSLMNYADLSLGTWYPKGGMHEIVKAFVSIAENNGVKFMLNSEVTKVNISNNTIESISVNDNNYKFDQIIATCDYHHFEQEILETRYQDYSSKYWNQRTMAPSSLLYYIGIDTKLPSNVDHHSLFFDTSFDVHANEIYKNPKWPSDPLFYMCCPSKSDPTVAPDGCENIFLLMPLAPGLHDTEEQREKYFKLMTERIKERVGLDITEHIIYKKSFAMKDFEKEYNSFKGNAYGLANTLMQTAFLKPKMRSKKIKNLLYAGQLTTPGPGVPPSIISGQVAALEIINNNKY